VPSVVGEGGRGEGKRRQKGEKGATDILAGGRPHAFLAATTTGIFVNYARGNTSENGEKKKKQLERGGKRK